MNLRPYQQETLQKIIDSFQQYDRVLCQLPTGAGKTAIAGALIKKVLEKTDKPIYWIVHRLELIAQTSRRFTEYQIDHGVIAGGYPTRSKQVQICTIQAISRRGSSISEASLMVIDEAHLAASPGYLKVQGCTKAKLLGLTATPWRAGTGGLGQAFERLITGKTVSQLMNEGYLVQPKLFLPPNAIRSVEENRCHLKTLGGDYTTSSLDSFLLGNRIIYGDAIEHYKQLIPSNYPTLVFCSSVKHIYECVEMFNANGIKSAGIDGKMTVAERADMLSRFRQREIQCLMSCQLLVEGYDFPECSAGILLRPTSSLIVHLQSQGRLLRPAAGKCEAIICDHVNNTGQHGPVWIDRNWTLEGRKSKVSVNTKGEAVKLCLRCGNYVLGKIKLCQHCGYDFSKPTKALQTVPSSLTLLTPDNFQQKIIQDIEKQHANELARRAIKTLIRERHFKRMNQMTTATPRKIRQTLEDFQELCREKGWKETSADKMYADFLEDRRIYREGDEVELTMLFTKQKNNNPRAKAKEVLAKRAEFNSSKRSGTQAEVFTTGGRAELRAYLLANPVQGGKEVTNIESYITAILSRRISAVVEQAKAMDGEGGTMQQLIQAVIEIVELPLSEAQAHAEKLLGMSSETKPGGEPDFDKLVAWANAKGLGQDNVENFVRNMIKKRPEIRAIINEGTEAQVVEVAKLLRYNNPEGWARTVVSTR